MDLVRRKAKDLAEGNLHEKNAKRVPILPTFHRCLADMDRISEGMDAAIEEKMKSERFQTELITNVSHDIKTPLTSIINYLDFLEQEEEKPIAIRIRWRNTCRFWNVSLSGLRS